MENDDDKLPGQAPTFEGLADPKKAKEKFEKDSNDYNIAKDNLRNKANDISNIAGANTNKEFKDAKIHADKHNKDHNTNFKSENQSKIKNAKKVGNMTSHAHRDVSGTIYGDKPVDESQRKKLDTFKQNKTDVKNGQENKIEHSKIKASSGNQNPPTTPKPSEPKNQTNQSSSNNQKRR